MTQDDRTETAMRLLTERRRAGSTAIREAVVDAKAAHEHLTRLLEEDDALHRSMHVLEGTTFRPNSSGEWRGPSGRTAVGRAQRILRDMELLERLISESSFGRPDSPRRTFGDRHLENRDVELVRVAASVADKAGRVRARDVARKLRELAPDRYSSGRSAYGAVYDQLSRSPSFEREGPGEFTIVAPFSPRLDSSELGSSDEQSR